MRKIQLFTSYNDDDEYIYDSISDFEQTNFRTHSLDDIHRASCTSFSMQDFSRGLENSWHQYWNRYKCFWLTYFDSLQRDKNIFFHSTIHCIRAHFSGQFCLF